VCHEAQSGYGFRNSTNTRWRSPAANAPSVQARRRCGVSPSREASPQSTRCNSLARSGRQTAIRKNRALLRAIAERQPKSVAELAAMTARAEQNVLRTLKKLETAGVVRLDKGEGRARRPVLAARKVHFEIDLLGHS
jgi:predicted transcriptional regulator